MEKDISQKITILPFQHVKAFSDVEDKQIYVGHSFLHTDVLDSVAHELAHVMSGDADHGPHFLEQLQRLGGKEPSTEDLFAKIRKRCGIDNNIAANIGNISGIQNILTDYHLLQAYRKFSQKILGTEGHWEVINEGNSDATGDSLSSKDQLIRLYPTPKGAFPVVVLYVPVIDHFRSPQARKICYDMMLAEAKCILGHSRRKIQGMPTPDGGSISYDGSDLVQEGEKMKSELIETAIALGEPLGIWLY